MKISILLPALNEGENLKSLVPDLHKQLSSLGLQHEIIVIDGGSSDCTEQVCAEEEARSIRQSGKGYAQALRDGMKAAKGDFIITLDADCSHPPDLIQEMWSRAAHADVVIASRFVDGGSSAASQFRHNCSIFLNFLYRKVLGLPVQDVSSGFRLYKRAVLNADDYECYGFDVLEEILLKIFVKGYQIEEVPLQYKPRRTGESHARIFNLAVLYVNTLGKLWFLRNSATTCDYDSRAFNSWILPQRYWQRKRYSIIHKFLGQNYGQLLDIGCGSSKIIQGLPDAVAFDLSPSKLRFLRKTNDHRVQGSTFSLPFKNNIFDTVIHSEVIEHVPLDPAIYHELYRVMKPGSRLIIGTPDYGRPWWPLTERIYDFLMPWAYADEHITKYTQESLAKILREHKFEVKDVKYILGGEMIMEAICT